MPERSADEKGQYRVVKNHEEQYSIWPLDKPLPGGWFDVGKVAARDSCLAYIREVWTDMRPRSIREATSALT